MTRFRLSTPADNNSNSNSMRAAQAVATAEQASQSLASQLVNTIHQTDVAVNAVAAHEIVLKQLQLDVGGIANNVVYTHK